MKNVTALVYLILCIPFLSNLQAQKSQSSVYLIQQMEHFKSAPAKVSAENFFREMRSELQLSPDSEMKLQKKELGYNGMVHLKYQQFHQEIPIFGASYILHCQDNKVESANGYFRPKLNLNTTPTISGEQALNSAIQDMNAETYIWEIAKDNSFNIYRKEKPSPELVLLDPAFPLVSETILLVYQIDLHSWKPYGKQRYFVNAHTGKIEKKISLIHHHAVPAKGQTKYYGIQDITVDSVAPAEFYLHDPSRGDGNTVYNFGLRTFQNESTFWDLTNSDQDEVALDAHYCTEKFYDLLLDSYQWDGLGNNGESMNSVIHIDNGLSIVNAFWDGEFAWFGDGNCTNGPLTTLEWVGHEFMHGVIDYTSNLISNSESGAINESLADVFGKLLEYKEDPGQFNWLIGASIHLLPENKPFRSFEDPTSLGHPDFYKGSLWDDNAFTHTNAAIGNHWFYLISDGKVGTNEIGESFDVKAIGIEKAAAIVFLTNRAYLTSNADYYDYFQTSILAAEELYGSASPEVVAVQEAWKAVGLSEAVAGGEILDLTIEIPSPFRAIRTCQQNGFVPLEFIISNIGDKVYIPKNNHVAWVGYTSSTGSKEILINLTDTLDPGEMSTIKLDTHLLVEGYENFEINYSIPSDDDVFFNNSTKSTFINSVHLDAEIELGGTIDKFSCENSAHQVTFSLYNKSCNPLAPLTPLTLSIQNDIGDIYWTETMLLHYPIPPQATFYFDRSVSFESEENFVQLVLDLPSDPVTDNNSSTVTFWKPYLADFSYSNQFQDEGELKSLQIDNFIATPLYPYNNESFFISTGLLDQIYFPDSCNYLNPLEILDGPVSQFSPVSAAVSLCTDLSNVSNPKLEFDLVQFRNDNLTEPIAESTMMRVAWNGVASGEEIIFGQTEGEVIRHSIPLPANFSGVIEFKVVTFTGVLLDNSQLFDYDVNLLGNISFSGDKVRTTIPAKEIIDLYPNPVSEQLYLKTNAPIQDISIINTQGQRLYFNSYFDGTPIDLTLLPNGYYWLSAWSEEFGKTIIPFVKN